MTFDDIYNFIVPNNFGVSVYAGNVLISNGVKYALENKAITNTRKRKGLFMDSPRICKYCYVLSL